MVGLVFMSFSSSAQELRHDDVDSVTSDQRCSRAVVADVRSVLVETEFLPEISSEVVLRCDDGTVRTLVRAVGRVGDVEIAWSDDVVVEVGDEVVVGADGRLTRPAAYSSAAGPVSQRSSTCVTGTVTLTEMYRALGYDYACRLSIGSNVYYVDDGDSFRNGACDAAMLVAYDDSSAEVCYSVNGSGLRVVDTLAVGNASGIPGVGYGFWQGVEVDLSSASRTAWLNTGGGSNFSIATTSNTNEGYSHCTHLFRGFLGDEGLGYNVSGGEIVGLSAY